MNKSREALDESEIGRGTNRLTYSSGSRPVIRRNAST